MKRILVASVAFFALAGSAVYAQTAAPTLPPLTAAPPVASNVIIVDIEEVLRRSDAGRDISNKLNAIKTTLEGELQPEATAIEAERVRLSNTPASQLQTEEFQNQRTALARRMQLLEAKEQYASAELQASQGAALAKFQDAIAPIERALLTSRNALIMVDSSSTIAYAPGVDATADLLTRLNAAVRTIDVQRVQPRGANGQVIPRPSDSAARPAAAAPAARPATVPASGPLPRQPATPAPRN